jgi:RNA polymerase sigma-70 factor (ECF subfamily)
MSQPDRTEAAGAGKGAWFTTTHWSVVLHAQDNSSPVAAEALEKLCGTYWYPLYAYARRQGADEESAKDLTQGFFARLLENRSLAQVQRQKGKFRSFMLASLQHFMSDERDKARALKRGGGQTLIALDDATGEERYRLEPADELDAAKLFERRWALALIEQARNRLEVEHLARDKGSLEERRKNYERLKPFLDGDRSAAPYGEVAAALGLSESAFKALVFRLRQRYRELVREEVAHTVESPDEIDAEIRYLIGVISG